MKKRQYTTTAVFLVAALLILTAPLLSQENQKKIVETVSVNWWQVPVFAVNSSGDPVTDLKADDIGVFVNGEKVEGFVFYKRAFQVTETKEERVPGLLTKEKPLKRPVVKNNTIFLLFDLTLSSSACSGRAKHVGRDIITRADPQTQFVLLTIEPFKGLHYIHGPSNDKEKLLNLLAKKVIPKNNKRLMDDKDFSPAMNQMDGASRDPGQSGAEGDTDTGGGSRTAFFYLRRSMGFFHTFESLYILFNTIDDNKFVYLFTEGISESLKGSFRGGVSMFNKYLRKSANFLGRSGVVLFIVNPMGAVDDTSLGTEQVRATSTGSENESYFSSVQQQSGEDSLRYLAKESGGKYLEGESDTIIQTLENMHRSYYEISFPDIEGMSGETRKIVVKPLRKGITVHTLRSLEKSKNYTQMSRVEQELFALNLISRNPMLKRKVKVQHARVTKMETNDQDVTYTVKLPRDYLRQKLVLYKFWIKDEQQVTRVEKEPLTPRKRKLVLSLPVNTDKDTRGTMPYFTLIDPANEKALVRVIGDRWTDSDEGEPKNTTAKLKAQTIDGKTFDAILEGAAAYCEKLKSSAFHYLCKEEISEIQNPLTTKFYGERISAPITSARAGRQYNVRNLSDMVRPGQAMNNKFTFSYRLFKTGEGIKEERQWYEDPEDNPINADKEKVVKHTKFFSERAVFAPATLLAQERQDLYKFEFLGYDTYKGQRCAVIRGVPLDPQTTRGFFGSVWIDLSDHSIMRVVADPQSINGYAPLKEFSITINSRLYFSLEMEFNEKQDGIRFPTLVVMLEKYKGGRIISRYRGPEGWERTRTKFNYTGYRFFNVQTQVVINQ